MDFCVVQQVQETRVIVTGYQLYQLPNKIHIKSDCLCLCKEFNRCVIMKTALHGLWTGLEQSSFSYPSLALLLSGTAGLQKEMFNHCRAARLLFHFINALDKKVRLYCFIFSLLPAKVPN